MFCTIMGHAGLLTFRAEFTPRGRSERAEKSTDIPLVYDERVSATRASLEPEFLTSSTRPCVYKIMSETKRKLAAGRSHGSCGSAPRNYGSCHGCSFVDGVFAPRGGCPNHEPRKLHPLPIPFPYYFAYPPSHEAPRTTPTSSSSSTLYLRHRLPRSSYTLVLHPRRRLTPPISSRIY